MKNRLIKISLLLVVIGLFVTGCGKKDSLTADDFKAKIEKEEKYLITDATSQFAGIKGSKYIKKVYIASDKEYKYQVEFYEFSSNDNAINFYEHNKELFEQEKKGKSTYTESNMFNYNKYTLKTNGKYNVLSRIDNTVAYVNGDIKYKKDIDSILKLIKY